MARPRYRRRVRALAQAVKESILTAPSEDPNPDPGATSPEDAEEHVRAVLEADPQGWFAQEWGRAMEADRQTVLAGWDDLRGRSIAQRAADSAARHNQRMADRNPLFAGAGALEEIAVLVTPEDREAFLRDSQANARAMSAHVASEGGRRPVDLWGRTNDGLSVMELRVWTAVFKWDGDPDPEAALTALGAICQGDRPRMLAVLAGILEYRAAKEAPPATAPTTPPAGAGRLEFEDYTHPIQRPPKPPSEFSKHISKQARRATAALQELHRRLEHPVGMARAYTFPDLLCSLAVASILLAMLLPSVLSAKRQAEACVAREADRQGALAWFARDGQRDSGCGGWAWETWQAGDAASTEPAERQVAW